MRKKKRQLKQDENNTHREENNTHNKNNHTKRYIQRKRPRTAQEHSTTTHSISTHKNSLTEQKKSIRLLISRLPTDLENLLCYARMSMAHQKYLYLDYVYSGDTDAVAIVQASKLDHIGIWYRGRIKDSFCIQNYIQTLQ